MQRSDGQAVAADFGDCQQPLRARRFSLQKQPNRAIFRADIGRFDYGNYDANPSRRRNLLSSNRHAAQAGVVTAQPFKAELTAAQRDALDSFVAPLPPDLFDRINMFEEMSRAFRTKLAEQIEPTLNEHLKTLDAASLPDRRKVAAWVNRFLRDLDLCVTIDGQPALFVAELRDARRPNSSRYALLAPKGERFTRVATDRDIPYLSLAAAPRRIDEKLRRVRQIAFDGRSH